MRNPIRVLAAAFLALAFGPAQAGRSETLQVSNAKGTLSYDLYLPSSYSADGPALPLVICLHGGHMTGARAAEWTGWNLLAEELGFIVAYPQELQGEPHRGVWNWSAPAREGREDRGASLIALVTTTVADTHRVDRQRVLISGISAGAGMAIAVAVTYPELYAAVGSEVGCAYGSFRCWDMPCTWSGCADKAFASLYFSAASSAAAAYRAMGTRAHRLPMIVSYGDDDWIASAVGQDTLVGMWLALNDWVDDGSDNESIPRDPARVLAGNENGAAYERSIHLDGAGCPLLERWEIAGLDHRYSGARDPKGGHGPGPDMRRYQYEFLLAQSAANRACGQKS